MTTVIREKRLISLNSSSATTYYNGSFLSNLEFNFSSILSPDNSIIYVEGGLQSAQLVASFYNVETNNNVFNYRISGINYNIQITPGNYNYSTLVSSMTSLLSLNGHTFTFALNQASNILTMTYTSVGTWQQILPSRIYTILGMDNTTYNIVSNTFAMPNLFNLIGVTKIKIYSQNLSINSLDSINNCSSNNLIETISVYVPGFSLIVYNNVDSTYGHLKTSYLSTLDIQIKDQNGNFIDFHGIDWTMSIILILYKKIEARTIPLTIVSPSSGEDAPISDVLGPT
jgi:hypothetical protein